MFAKFLLEYCRTLWKIFSKLGDSSGEKVNIFSVCRENFSLLKLSSVSFHFLAKLKIKGETKQQHKVLQNLTNRSYECCFPSSKKEEEKSLGRTTFRPSVDVANGQTLKPYFHVPEK